MLKKMTARSEKATEVTEDAKSFFKKFKMKVYFKNKLAVIFTVINSNACR